MHAIPAKAAIAVTSFGTNSSLLLSRVGMSFSTAVGVTPLGRGTAAPAWARPRKTFLYACRCDSVRNVPSGLPALARGAGHCRLPRPVGSRGGGPTARVRPGRRTVREQGDPCLGERGQRGAMQWWPARPDQIRCIPVVRGPARDPAGLWGSPGRRPPPRPPAAPPERVSAAGLFGQIFPAGVQMTGELLADIEQWARLTGELVAQGSVARQAQPGGDLAEAAAIGQHPVHLSMPAPRPVRDLAGTRGSGRCGRSMAAAAASAAAASAAACAATAAGRCSLCSATARSTAPARLCHRCHRSATCTASGAPCAPPSA
jgi:hypothetical protein